MDSILIGNPMNYKDHVDMVNGVIRDIAAFDIARNGHHVDEGAIALNADVVLAHLAEFGRLSAKT